MNAKDLLRIIGDLVNGTETPKPKEEVLKEKLEEGGLFKLTRLTPEELEGQKINHVIQAMTRIVPKVNDQDPASLLLKFPKADDAKIKENYDFIKDCVEHFEELCRYAIRTGTGCGLNLTADLSHALSRHHAYLVRNGESWKDVEVFQRTALQIYERVYDEENKE
jgi:hypothetical protein